MRKTTVVNKADRTKLFRVSPLFDVAQRFAETVVRIRRPIQLSAFLFSAAGYFLINRVDPNNINSLIVVCVFGVTVVVVPLAFDSELIKQMRQRDRMWFLLVLMAMFLGSSVGMASMIISYVVYSPDPSGTRFDTRFKLGGRWEKGAKEVTFTRLENGESMVEFSIEFFPTTQNSREGATVFLGIVNVHDYDKRGGDGAVQISNKPCSQSQSCLGYHIFNELTERPLFVRGGAPSFSYPVAIRFKDDGSVRNIQIYWEFYQKESAGGATCGYDNDHPAPEGVLPTVALYAGNRKSNDKCHLSYDIIRGPLYYAQKDLHITQE